MYKILVTNDDGINAEGIKILVKALSKKAEVYISAPHDQRSATGHGITVGKPITMTKVNFEGAKMAVECTGLPADCVKLGQKYYESLGIKFNFVYSGINHGGNLGTDTLYSGTVSAAVEGALCKIPAVALSVNSHEPVHFEYIEELIESTFDNISKNLKAGTVLNINVPHLPKEEVKGIKFTRLGIREYREWFTPLAPPSDVTEYKYKGEPRKYDSTNTNIDVIADQEGYASITPLKFDLTDHEKINEIKEWI